MLSAMAARSASSRLARFSCAGVLLACSAAPAPTALPGPDASASAGSGPGGGAGGATAQNSQPLVAGRVRRLTRLELENTLDDLLGDEASALAKSLEADSGATKFSTAADRGVGTSYVSDLNHLAALAASHLAQARESAELTDACASDEAGATACASAFLRAFGARAWRRPLTDTELVELLVVYQAGRVTAAADAGPEARLRAGLDNAVRALLQAPSFVFRTELGEANAADGGGPLTGFEAAAALSYGLTASPPDDELRVWAASGEPLTIESVTAQGRRLLEARPERYARLAEVFVREWLSIDLSSPAWRKDTALYPQATPEFKASLDRETTLFLQQWARSPSLTDLLTAPRGYVSRSNAWIYGIAQDSPLFMDGAPEFSAVDLDPRTRAGVLTLPGFLGSLAHEGASSPVLRGVAVMRKLLCLQPPPVPAMIPPLPPQDASATPTTRARYEQHTSVAFCASCHQAFDPMGYTFEHYDAIGAYRDDENGVAIDSHGALVDGESSVAEISDAVVLASLLAASPHVHDCFVRQAYRFTSGQTESAANTDALSAETKAFEAHDLNVAELMLRLVTNLAALPRSPSRVEP
jgi:hypothetical protein